MATKTATIKKRTTTKKEEAAATEPVEPRTLSTRTIDPAAVAAAAAAAMRGGGGGQGVPWLKLDKSKTTLRIFPGDPLFVSYRQNTTRLAGRINTTLDFQTVFGTPEIHDAALAGGMITSEDFDKYQMYGDPFVSTMVALKNAGIKLPKGKNFWPQTKFYMNAINRADNKVYLWDASRNAFEAIMALVGTVDEDTGEFVVGEYPELFDAETGFDINITGNGKDGLQRRYTAYTPARSGSELGEFEGEPIELIGQLVRRVASWDDRARQMFASYGSAALQAGITPELWGLGAVPNAGADPDGDIEEDPES